MRRYPTAAKSAAKAREIWQVEASTDGGKTWAMYSSAGNYSEATGYSLNATIRADHVAEFGPDAVIGETLPTWKGSLLQVATGQRVDHLIRFTRTK